MTTHTKFCSKCSEDKTFDCFSKNSRNKDGLQNYCKDCNKIHYEANKSKILEKNKLFYQNNPERKKEISAKYHSKKESLRKQGQFKRWVGEEQPLYRTCICCNQTKENTAENFCIQRGITRNLCRICNSQKLKVGNNCPQLKQRDEQRRKYKREYQQKIRQNPLEVIKSRVRKRYLVALQERGFKKTSKTAQILGCSWEEFKTHIESFFNDEINWDTRDNWHIDHIVPLATANTEDEVIRLNHYTNLRPLKALDNLKKGAKTNYII